MPTSVVAMWNRVFMNKLHQDMVFDNIYATKILREDITCFYSFQ